ncbi:MAG: TetR/AcrR family transcriptional regulator, partial [Solirubrobacteraceae bacterium]
SPYTSERRARQAEATRRDIVAAARALFAERGYAATSMTDIARSAGVAIQTIYASCGSKRDLLLALNDAIDREADVAALAEQAAKSEDPTEILTLGVRLTCQLHERCGDIIAALLSGAEVDPDAAAAIEDGKRRHRAGAAGAARKLAALDALRDDITADDAAGLIAVLTWQPIYTQLIREHGWDLAQCERVITTTLRRSLLR